MVDGLARDWFCYGEYRKSSVRCKVEHAFHIIKNTFGFSKVCYCGTSKNLNRLYMLAASANLLMCARSGAWRKRPARDSRDNCAHFLQFSGNGWLKASALPAIWAFASFL